MGKGFLGFGLAGLLLLLCLHAASATAYFVDFTGGVDTQNGTSTGTAWKTISKVNTTAFVAGDVIQFKRGETWTGTTLVIDSTGVSGNPVTYTAYGTGALPVLQTAASPPSGDFSHTIEIPGDWNVVEHLLVRHGHEAAIFIPATGSNNVVQDCEVTASGLGFLVVGSDNTLQRNLVHDLLMVIDDAAADTDYGAVCFWLNGATATNNKILHNTGLRCRHTSTDYGFDGGGVEFFNGGTGTEVAYNWFEGTDGLFEYGGTGLANTVDSVTFHHNIFFDNFGGACLHNTGGFAVTITNLKFEHNTFYKQGTASGFRFLDCTTNFAAVTLRNNIFISNIQIANATPAVHTNNRYQMINMVNGSGVGYTLGTGETTGDPLLVNPGGQDVHLQAGSPARDTGAVLGYVVDYSGTTVPQGSAPDLGALEFVDAVAPLFFVVD